MRRPWLVTITAVLEAVLGLALIGVAVQLLGIIKVLGDASDLVAAGLLGMIGLPAVVSCWGLWKGRAWGWWLALVVASLGLIAFLRDPITRRVQPDVDELAFIVTFALLLLLLMLSPVRRFFLRRDERRADSGASP